MKVIHLRGELDFLRTVTSTAEHTWALLLALVRHIPTATADVADGYWQQDVHRGRELHGKTLGILGFGRLGQIVARYGRAFGMRICTYDVRTVNTPEYVDDCESMVELLSTCDVLTVHIPLNADTEGLIGRHELSELPEKALLVNTSRGELIDEQALIEALDAGRLAGVAVDVVANEEYYEANGPHRLRASPSECHYHTSHRGSYV